MRLALLRHGRTAWNEQGRMQGRADLPLSPAARAEVARWRLPDDWAAARWLSSPLRRASETAALLTSRSVAIEPRLIEMDWGAWEGRTLAELRAQAPAAMAANEARGLDFRPDRGESPREVRGRLAELIAELADAPGPGDAVLVTHKGVIRAALSLATGWDMIARPPLRLTSAIALVLRCDGGRLELDGSFRL